MSSVDSFARSEERAVAIFFCSIAASGTPENPSPEVLPELKASFDVLLRSECARHDGTFIDSVGDTAILIFGTSSEAVETAFALRESLSAQPLTEEPTGFLVRIGIHYARVIVEADSASGNVTIGGDGVRFAARLLNRLPKNGVGLSDPARRNLTDALKQEFVRVSGEKERLQFLQARTWDPSPENDDPFGNSTWLDRKTVDRLQFSAPATPYGGTSSHVPPAAFSPSPPAAPAPASVFAPLPGRPAPAPFPAPIPAPMPTPPVREDGKPLTREWKPGEPKDHKLYRLRPKGPSLEDEFLAALEENSPIDYASEAVVVIDIVQATATSDLYGWYSVGRRMVRYLRKAVRQIGEPYGLACMKSTGDGLLLTYRDTKAADVAAVNAVRASLELLERLHELNQLAPEERRIALRFALHFGEVDVLPDDREGPNVSFTFRVEAINRASLKNAFNPMEAELLPERDYILCSERVHDIVTRRNLDWGGGADGVFNSCGFFKLKGFTALHEVFLVSGQTRTDA